jgi:hypothetical protein
VARAVDRAGGSVQELIVAAVENVGRCLRAVLR